MGPGEIQEYEGNPNSVIRNLTILAGTLLCILLCLIVSDQLRIPSKTLVIFYTSNLRGQINPFSGDLFERHYDKLGGIAFLRGMMDDTIAQYKLDPRYVLLLDSGDSLYGSAEASLTLGEVPYDLMVKAGYDAMAVGNMEFEFGMDVLRKFTEAGKLPMLACNYRDIKAPLGNTFIPGKIIVKNDVKIGVIGLGHGDLARNIRQENVLQVEITDMRAAVQKTALELKGQGAELIVLLSHHPALDNLMEIEKMFPDVDVVIGDLIGPPPAGPNTRPLICQTAPARGAGLGMVKIPFMGGEWNLSKAFRAVFPIDSSRISPNRPLLEEVNKLESRIDSLLEEVIAHANGDFKRAYSDESTIGNLITDSMKFTAKTDIALQNSGGIKSTISSGAISLRDLYDLLPFENSVVKLELQGWEIENILEESLAEQGSFLQASGLQCLYSSKNPKGFRIFQISVNDEPLEFSKTYTVAVNDFMLSNNLGWPELGKARGVTPIGLLRENFKNYLISQGTVSPSLTRRFNDIQDRDETLRIQALSFEIASLSEPLVHDGTWNSPYARFLSDLMRTEADADLAILPIGMIKNRNDPLQIVTPARLFSDFPESTPLKTAFLTGEEVQQQVAESLATPGREICFSGFSVELKDGKFNRIFPWVGDFEKTKVYKVALPGNIGSYLPGLTDLSKHKPRLEFSDLRRVFATGIRRKNGKVELHRAEF